jgi:hypothetical protein
MVSLQGEVSLLYNLIWKKEYDDDISKYISDDVLYRIKLKTQIPLQEIIMDNMVTHCTHILFRAFYGKILQI